MKILTYIDRINLLHKLVQQKRTGTPEELATRLGVSVSRLYQLMEELRMMDVPIFYSRLLRSYYYTHDFEIRAELTARSLKPAKRLEVKEGLKIGNPLKENP